MRLNKILSAAGIASRRKADDLILAGRVMINGQVVRTPGVQADWDTDRIQVDDREIPRPSERIYLLLNKPFGYICSLHDPQGRPIVTGLLRDIGTRIYPVGRLDFDSLGLLLLTNDGDWAHHLAHPRYHVPKTYKVICRGQVGDQVIETLQNGITLEDGFVKPSKINLIEHQGSKSMIRMTLTSGKQRIVRRMLAFCGLEVLHLIRIGFGALELGELKIGQYRYLEPQEIETMKKMAGVI